LPPPPHATAALIANARRDTLRSSVDAMRSDLTQVALAVGTRPRAQND